MTETPVWLSKLGRFNDMPEPYVPCTEELFWLAFDSHSAKEHEFRQVYLKAEGWETARNVHIWWFFNFGLAVAIRLGTSPSYYFVGCSHANRFEGESVICDICGFSYHKPDSSG